MVKTRGDAAVIWIWRGCKVAWESGCVTHEWTKAVILPMYKGKDNSNNYKGMPSYHSYQGIW